MDLSKIDVVLSVLPSQINEDERVTNITGSPDWSWHGAQYDVPDVKLYNTFAFGKVVSASLENLGRGFYHKITDFSKYVIVTIGYHNQITGRANEKTFLIDFTLQGKGIIISSSLRYRTINGVTQAISYIKSAAQSMKNNTDRT